MHALLAAAFGRGSDRGAKGDVLPDGLMLDAPEIGRTSVRRGEPFAFGFTLLADEPEHATRILTAIVEGLRVLGRAPADRPLVFAGNFELKEVCDVVRGCEWRPDRPLECVPRARVEAEADAAGQHNVLTLRFTSPLRMLRPRPCREKGAECFDARYFDPTLFVNRALRRLHDLGLCGVPQERDRSAAPAIELIENRLVWMDYAYGGADRRKILAGAVGRVRLRSLSRSQATTLVWAQYARVGQATRFGQGAFRIEELGVDPLACPRSVSLLNDALDGVELDEAAAFYDLPAGVIRRAARQARTGQYQPSPASRLPIVQSDGRERTLAIPTRLDRSLQRTIVAKIAPSLDKLLEDASVAYRRGLGRTTAARHIRRAFEDGYRYGLRADFRRFFDSIDHGLLRDRLDAYLGDDRLAELLMRWVASASPQPGRGIPTGSPISPMLANLFLDQFDEEIAAEGARLVRYADDFLILYRTQAEAEAVFKSATDAARALELELNASKTRHVELGAFEFLGYRFERRDRWVAEPIGEPRRIEEIGWRQAPKPSPRADWPLLPGETEAASRDDRSWVVIGPGASHIRADGPELRCSYGDGRETRVSLERVQEVLILGRPGLSGSALTALVKGGRRVLLADDRGRVTTTLSRIDSVESPEAVAGQVRLARDDSWRTQIARQLIAAKIANYAALADATEPSPQRPLGPVLRTYVERALAAESLETLRGIEGAAAARWYGALGARLPAWCRFERRVAPDADDPANAMLNLAMTALHRQMVLAIRLAGLVPTIGFFHAPRPGHATLASDLQEPFRHLMERAVIHATRLLKPSDFKREAASEPPMRISGPALRKILGVVHATFAHASRSAAREEACTYRTHLLLAARSLRRHLEDRAVRFEAFQHPGTARPEEPVR